MITSLESMRKDALGIFQQGIDAADPYLAVKNCLTLSDNHLEIALDVNDASKKRIGYWQKIHVIAFGKAAFSMAKAVKDVIPDQYLADTVLAVTNYENEIAHKNVAESGIELLGASHPLPDLAGLKAAKTIAERLKKTKQNELVLVLISGGGSALIPFPAADLTLEDKIATTDFLLASGADINQINCVRKHLSQLKGGQFAKLATPADIHSLILSDVMGDDISSIASGPTVPDDSTFADAINILNEKLIWHKIPSAVQDFLLKGERGEIEETPNNNQPFFENSSHTIIGSNTISLCAAVNRAKAKGYKTDIFSQNLSGEAREAAKQLISFINDQLNQGLSITTAILSGGETTVTLNGEGRGGRNQEMVLAFIIAAKKTRLKGKWVFLSGGTDGRDGPTDAAGGLVDSETFNRINKLDLNPEEYLDDNDSYTILKKSQDLLITGATGTNVADLQVLLIQPE